ncbi:phenylalanine--tRNA ligase subunit alpha [Natribacillus halophilus]|uniref:Phenylalanine--tRNA ligase alpha subunit n=1 Tax=Natribacillus halophilus TaxID=549003 RepID=A0A1G8LV84_9BACI|nr:phenylalanine--tRNA ligase subunit alpha [Natribacillus halophilus]SDI59588.1 phenylalanyl-tRNA synthetase, alpha subunit [Natribacillus halophilus]
MIERLQEIESEALAAVQASADKKELEQARIQYLGKKGAITEVLRGMGQLPEDERPVVGQKANEVRENIQEAITGKSEAFEKAEWEQRLEQEEIDVTLPGRPVKQGSTHPLTAVVEEIEDIFIGLGFDVTEGPEVETDYFNFEMINLPPNHPARDMQDSFYISEDTLLRTQTSPVQARTLQKHEGEGPVRIICPGKVYRRDEDDATHSHQFMQIEGLYVDENVRMSDLKGIFDTFVKHYFGQDRQIRLRPSFFPFTEPSAEIDVTCGICAGDGCRICKQSGWIEVLGSGMVHPRVLELNGFDPEVYSGFAFGMGVERFAMLKYGIDDIRHFYTNDKRFLSQFQHL